MAGKTDYLENKIIDWMFRGQAYTPPTIIYVGLFTATPSDAGGGTEVSGGAYARAGLTGSLTNWAGTNGAGGTGVSSGSSGITSNNVAITFPAPTGANWGVITSFGIFDAADAGNLLFWGPLTTNKTVNDGDAAPSFPAGTLTVTED